MKKHLIYNDLVKYFRGPDDAEEFIKAIQSTEILATLKQEGEKFQQYLCTIIVCIGALAIGGNSAWTSPGLPFLSSSNSSAPFMLKSSQEGDTIAALMPFGAIIGTLPAGTFADFFGRKLTMHIFSVPLIASWLMTTFAINVYMLYAARVLAGVVFGTFCGVLPMYINEISEVSVRGTLGSLFELFLIIGHLVVYLLGMSNSYLVLCYSMTAISIIVFFSLHIVPESPIHMVKKKKFRRAEKILQRLRGPNYNVSVELDDIRSYLQYIDRPTVSKSIVYNKVKVKALFICCGLMVFQQLSGTGAVIYFADMIFDSSGASNPSLCSIIMASAQVVATVVTVALVDRIGRKILLYISSAMTGLCMVALGYYFWMLENKKDTSNISWIPLGSLVIYIIGYSFGLGPISWLMSVEVLDPEIRSLGATVTAATCLILLTLVTFFFQPITQLITTAVTFWLFAFFCGLSILFVWMILPETKGIPIQEVQVLLAKKKMKPLD